MNIASVGSPPLSLSALMSLIVEKMVFKTIPAVPKSIGPGLRNESESAYQNKTKMAYTKWNIP